MAVSSEVWATARTIWENEPNISYRELLEKLQVMFGDKAPKSTGAVTKRKNKEKWVKVNLVNKKETIEKSKQKEKKGEQKKSSNSCNNKEKQESEVFPILETAKETVQQEINNLAMSAKERANIIIKHRKRLQQLGEFQEVVLDTAKSLDGYDIDSEEDGDQIRKILIVSKEMSSTLNQLTTSQKLIAEQEFALCGITADDFTQSEQERRLGALSLLDGIADEEREARNRLKGQLMERLAWIEDLENGD